MSNHPTTHPLTKTEIKEIKKRLERVIYPLFDRRGLIWGHQKKEVRRMTAFQKIRFLEEVVDDQTNQCDYREILPHQLTEIIAFLKEIGDKKELLKVSKDNKQPDLPTWKVLRARKGLMEALAQILDEYRASPLMTL